MSSIIRRIGAALVAVIALGLATSCSNADYLYTKVNLEDPSGETFEIFEGWRVASGLIGVTRQRILHNPDGTVYDVSASVRSMSWGPARPGGHRPIAFVWRNPANRLELHILIDDGSGAAARVVTGGCPLPYVLPTSAPFWTRDGSTIYFALDTPVDDRGIWAVDADGTDCRRVVESEVPRDPVVSDDGLYLAWVIGQGGEIILHRLDGSEPDVVIGGIFSGAIAVDPAFAPGTHTLAISIWQNSTDQRDIGIVIDGAVTIAVTGPDQDYEPQWVDDNPTLPGVDAIVFRRGHDAYRLDLRQDCASRSCEPQLLIVGAQMQDVG